MSELRQGRKKYMLGMMEKLLPCRKCGCLPIGEEYGRGLYHLVEIICSNKKCDSGEVWSVREINAAIKSWNRREATDDTK